MIVGVAIRWPSTARARPWVITAKRPSRHHDVLLVAHEFAKRDQSFAAARRKHLSGEQGFVDEHGNFLTREQAAQHARACGQVTELRFQPDKLFSEDVW